MNLYQALKVLDRVWDSAGLMSYPDKETKEAIKVLRAAARRRPMRIELDFTERAKEQQHEKETTDLLMFPDINDVALSAYFGNGEHFATTPEKRDPSAGRKAAKTLERYMLAEIVDLTK